MSNVTIEEAARSLHDLIDRASRGESVIITADGGPIARLVAVSARHGHPTFGSARGLIEMASDFDAPLVDMKDYEQ